VLHIDPERAWGGGERQVVGLLKYLAERGHDCRLLCHPDAPLSREARVLGIATQAIRMRNDLDPRPAFVFRRLVRTGSYDIVHFHTKRAHSLAAWLGGLRWKAKIVVTRRMDYPIKPGLYTDFLYNRQTDGIAAISRKIAAVLVDGGVRREKIRVIYSGIEPELFDVADSRRGREPLVVGTLAGLVKRKGHRYLLEAAARLKQQGVQLRYCWGGEGPERGNLEELALRLGLHDDVSFLGFVSDAPRFLASVDVFALPSLFEGLGVAVLEAMAAGKPVVASAVGGIPELVQDQTTGILVPPGDCEALAGALSRLASNPELMRAMGDAGRETVRQGFTMERMALQNEAFYYDILDGKVDHA
jgi:glycosyltransferase involved in cell wall biosynthesis